jgi:hypothetical protein
MHEPLTGGDLVEVSDVVEEVHPVFRVEAAGGDGVLEFAPRELFLVELVVGHCIPPGWLRADPPPRRVEGVRVSDGRVELVGGL